MMTGRKGRLMQPRTYRVVLICAALLVLAFVGLAERAEDQGAGLPWVDLATKMLVQSGRRPVLERPMHVLSNLGTASGLVPLGLGAMFALWRNHRRLALFVPSMPLGGLLIEGLSKWLVHRPRPRLTGYRFPSGHVLAAVSFYGALVCVAWALASRPAWRWTATGVCVLAVLSIGYSRLYLNAHWLTDVLGALAGGTAYLLGALVWIDARSQPRPPMTFGLGGASAPGPVLQGRAFVGGERQRGDRASGAHERSPFVTENARPAQLVSLISGTGH
jgi:membrane-associated phospholipid phosphatase